MTFAILRFLGKIPIETEILKITRSVEEIPFFKNFRIFVGIL